MAEVTIARTGQLLRQLLEIIMKHPDGMQAQDALFELRRNVVLTPYEQGTYSSGGPRFEKIVRFATVDLVKAGWLIKDKGRWMVTEDGRNAYRDYKDPELFYRTAQQLYRKWRKSHLDHPGKVEVPTEEKKAVVTFEEAEEQAWAEIEDYLRSIPPYDFQKLVAALLKAMGYHVSWIAPPGKDGGVDIIAWNDPLGTRPPRIKVQVKREQNTVSVGTLRSFMALLGDDDVGIFVSTGGFTRDAEEEARTQQSRQVTLINLYRLYELWIEHLSRLDEESKDLFPLKPIYFLAPES
ncbi:MAG TPA: Mrr restriction system protein [Anaerolineaceae bacterium]|nr:Mrr restriction system protein [Anaerolineaceae bacterium]